MDALFKVEWEGDIETIYGRYDVTIAPKSQNDV
jgi:hypothetical protein